jgi:hypothetical protein
VLGQITSAHNGGHQDHGVVETLMAHFSRPSDAGASTEAGAAQGHRTLQGPLLTAFIGCCD